MDFGSSQALNVWRTLKALSVWWLFLRQEASQTSTINTRPKNLIVCVLVLSLCTF